MDRTQKGILGAIVMVVLGISLLTSQPSYLLPGILLVVLGIVGILPVMQLASVDAHESQRMLSFLSLPCLIVGTMAGWFLWYVIQLLLALPGFLVGIILGEIGPKKD